jgi:hypothetical protein
MAGVVAFSDDTIWKVANYEFRLLLTRLSDELDDREDASAVTQAMYMQAFSFDGLPRAQAIRIAPVMGRVADELRWEIEANPRDDRDLGFARRLAELEMLLHDVYE